MKNSKLRIIFIVFLWLALLFSLRVPDSRAETVLLSFSYGYLFPADSGYKEVYGNKVRLPEFKLGFRVVSDVYIYGIFCTFNQNGLTPELMEPAYSKQQFFGGGLAYFPSLTKRLKIFIGAGLSAATYEEQAMEITVSGNKLGFLVEGGLYLKEKFILLGISGSYCAASDIYEGVSFKIGGTRISGALGFIF